MIASRILIIITSLLIVSCNVSELCEEFNFKRIPFDKNYYNQRLTYTNDYDTITIFPSIKDYSKKSFIDPISNPECSPYFTIYYEPKSGNKLNILYSFQYYPQGKNVTLDVILNSSSFKLKVSPSSEDSTYKVNEFEQLNENDLSSMIHSVKIQNMYISEFETILGEKWRMIFPLFTHSMDKNK